MSSFLVGRSSRGSTSNSSMNCDRGERLSVDLEDGHIEGSSSEVVDHDRLVGRVLVAVGDGRGGRLVDDLLDLDAAGLPGPDRGGPLEIVEIGGDRDDGLLHLLAGGVLGILDQLLQEDGAQVLGRVVLAVEADGDGAVPHAPLERGGVDAGTVGLHVLGVLSDEDVAIIQEADHRRRDLLSECVRDDNRLVVLLVIPCNCRVGRS